MSSTIPTVVQNKWYVYIPIEHDTRSGISVERFEPIPDAPNTFPVGSRFGLEPIVGGK
jgi:hypothetical protein